MVASEDMSIVDLDELDLGDDENEVEVEVEDDYAKDQVMHDEEDEDDRPKPQTAFNLKIKPLKSSSEQNQKLIVSVIPPKLPQSSASPAKRRSACDIVLVIDVSGSMHCAAPVPVEKGSEQEENGLSVLDLVKHAARTILSTLEEGDRLGIVAYSDQAEVISKLTPVTAENKVLLSDDITCLETRGMTNMWDGIKTGLTQFVPTNDDTAIMYDNNVRAMLVLTDGLPNMMNPAQGFVVKIQELYPTLPCTIHTFGFGYSLKSGLLKSIAEIGHGTYNFIPDAGFIGTVFVHAVANLQATCATEAILTLTSKKKGLRLKRTMGDGVELGIDALRRGYHPAETMQVSLGNVQYAQSRDIVIEIDRKLEAKTEAATPDTDEEWEDVPKPRSANHSPAAADDDDVEAVLTFYDHDTTERETITRTANTRFSAMVPGPMETYHLNRSHLLSFLSTLFPIHAGTGEHSLPTWVPNIGAARERLWTTIHNSINPPSSSSSSPPENEANDPEGLTASLLQDIEAEPPHGQIKLAIDVKENWGKWGRHYLLSLLSAHKAQACNSFMDPGPLMYGRDSEVFQRCKKALDQAFDELPAPTPSRTASDRRGGMVVMGKNGPINMGSYNSSSNPCFAGGCMVRIDSSALSLGSRDEEGVSTLVKLEELRIGQRVWTPAGGSEVLEIVKSACHPSTPLIRLEAGDGSQLLITPWHPIFHQDSWTFPADISTASKTTAGAEGTEHVYSLLLRADADPDRHVVEVEGVRAVTLGNGVRDLDDARCHPFWSDHEMVCKSLRRLKVDGEGRRICGGLSRDEKTGLADGFLRSRI